MKAKKLEGNNYQIEEIINSSKKISVVSKAAVEQAIKILEYEILAKQNQLALKKKILNEIKKVK